MTLWMPNKKKPLYAPMLATFGGGSVRGFQGAGGGIPNPWNGTKYWEGTGSNWDFNGNSISTTASGTPTQINVLSNFSNMSTAHGSIGAFKFSPDGTKMVILGYNSNLWAIHTLATPFDITGGSTSKTEKSMGSQMYGFDVHISEDGSKLYHAGFSIVEEYSLGTPWDMNTISGIQNMTNISGVGGIHLSSDGRYFVINSQNTNLIYVYYLSTAWDISTRGSQQTISNGGNNPRSLVVSEDGKTFVWQQTGGSNGEAIAYFECSTAWNLSTAGSITVTAITTDDSGMGFDIAADASGIYYGSYAAENVWKFT